MAASSVGSSLRICVLQLPALLRRECAAPADSRSSNPAASMITERKQQQMQRVQEAILRTLDLLRRRPEAEAAAPLSFSFADNLLTVFSPSAVAAPPNAADVVGLSLNRLPAATAAAATPFDLLVLPEMWASPYHCSYFAAFAEEIPACDTGTKGRQSANVGIKHHQQQSTRGRATAEESGKPAEYTNGGAAADHTAGETASPAFAFMRALARRLHVFVVGGSIVEKAYCSLVEQQQQQLGKGGDEGQLKLQQQQQPSEVNEGTRLYNTCCVFDPEGNFIAKYRKSHLFDIQILKEEDPNGKGMIFQESATLCAGNNLSSFSLPPFGEVGLGICYDLRFPEFALALAQGRGCRLLCYPGAFNQTTGPAHWSLLLRSRALDNQAYVVGCSPAAAPTTAAADGEYPCYGHSMVVGPFGDVLAELQQQPGVLIVTATAQRVNLVRKQIPISKQKRSKLYTIVQENLPSVST